MKKGLGKCILGACMSARCSLLITMPLLNKACIAQAFAYAVAVSVAGGDAYESAQDAACVWEPCCCDEQ
jgi:hypothetical protein